MDWEEREGIAQYVIERARMDAHLWIDPEIAAYALGVRVVPASPRGCQGLAVLEPPEIWIGRRRSVDVAAHELAHVGTYWCLPPGVPHDEAETDDIAARIVVPSRHLRRLVRRFGAAAAERYIGAPKKLVRTRIAQALAELNDESSMFT